MTGGRPLSFYDLSVGEALARAPKERENSGGGKFPSQISRRKDQAGSLGTEEKISPPFSNIYYGFRTGMTGQTLQAKTLESSTCSVLPYHI